MLYIIHTPVPGYSGAGYGIQFSDGVGCTDDSDLADKLRKKGYQVEAEDILEPEGVADDKLPEPEEVADEKLPEPEEIVDEKPAEPEKKKSQKERKKDKENG